MERTGHRSVAGVRTYKRTSDILIENCSAILDNQDFCHLVKSGKSNAEGNGVAGENNVILNFSFKDCNVTINN